MTFKPLNLLTMPLDGINLIEASAGTGKTFTISNLFLRLILEKGFDIRNILVVTFTDAATRELRDRIRQNLTEALSAFVRDDDLVSCENEIIRDILTAGLAIKDRKSCMKQLKKAVVCFDEASIFTIHGFCSRMLSENAFESSLMFDMELMKDQSRMIREITDDFWRINFSNNELLTASIARKNGLDPSGLYRFSSLICGKPLLKFLPGDIHSSHEELLSAFDLLKLEWEQSSSEICEILYQDTGLGRGVKAYKKESLDAYIKNLEICFYSFPHTAALKSLYMFSESAIALNMKKNKVPPEHHFFHLCETFLNLEKKYIIWVKTVFTSYLKVEFEKRKQNAAVHSFDDLLMTLNRSLTSKGGSTLACAIRMNYQTALIDEFQDTDPIQYEIFKSVFFHETCSLFMIGDPKQSIYGFRGADIFSYLEASGNVPDDRKYTLDTNWRSETAMVKAVNCLFNQVENPFVLGNSILFNGVCAAEESLGNRTPLRDPGGRCDPLQVWYLKKQNPTPRSKNPSKEEAARDASESVIYEISRLLSRENKKSVKIGDKDVTPSDIAVLVTRNKDAVLFKDQLGALGIPAVITKADNIFETSEAAELQLLLSAISMPGQIPKLNGALCSSMIGFSGENIRSFMEDDAGISEYEYHIETFSTYHDEWNSWGFMRMFRKFLFDYRVRENLLALPYGERKLTNLLHLSELIHTAELENGFGINGVLSYLSDQRQSEERLEEHELRLERDDEAVQILTVFKSKGLQYPIVFCPFMWRKNAEILDDVVFHKEKHLYLDMGSDDVLDSSRLASMENLSELVRLLYVAVTRAKNRCYLTFGKIGKSGAGALEYILTGGMKDDGSFNKEIVSSLKKKIRAMDEDSLFHEVKSVCDAHENLIGITEWDRKTPYPYHSGEIKYEDVLSYKTFRKQRRIVRDWRIASFSMLTSGKGASLSAIDESPLKKDESVTGQKDDDVVSPASFFHFPTGAVPGSCIHHVFENLDFSLVDVNGIKSLIKSSLVRFGLYDDDVPDKKMPTRVETVYRMVNRVMKTDLMQGEPGLRLKDLSPDNMIPELEFYFPVKKISVDKLKGVFMKHHKNSVYRDTGYPEKIGRLTFRPLHGFMLGFIDLVILHGGKYYILDWKSNHLGNHYDNYTKDKLKESMIHSLYNLQYYIYTVAIHKYLESRIHQYNYDDHFGGAFYLYIRGVHPEKKGCGVFFDKPDKALIEDLCGLFGV